MKNKIVVVDDDISIVNLLKKILEENGYDVLCFNSPLNIINEIREFIPSVIMLDIHMPHKSGIELLKEIKADAVLKKIPVVMLSVDGNPSEIHMSMLYGANTYILKPAKTEDILNVIRSILLV